MLMTKSLDSICHRTADPLTRAILLSPFSSDDHYSVLCIYMFVVFLYFNYFKFHKDSGESLGLQGDQTSQS